MSDAVERRIVALVDKPLVCPHGNPIPGLEELGLPFAAAESTDPLLSLTEAAQTAGTAIIVDRISEQLQPDAGVMKRLSTAGVLPGRRVQVSPTAEGVTVEADGAHTTLRRSESDHIFVRLATSSVGQRVA
jgi:DtxR family Mn-dependent transcriptional regulator